MTLVSVLMPAKNAASTIAASARSLAAQTHPDWELILVDDGSTDSTAAQAEAAIPGRVRLVRHARSRGVAVSLNHGLHEARGEVLVRLDADDIAAPNRLARQVALLRSSPMVDAVATAFRYIDRRGRALPSPRAMAGLSGEGLARLMLVGNPICHPSIAFRAGTIARYPEEFQFEDHALWLLTRRSVRWTHEPARLTRWRLHSGQYSQQKRSLGIEQLAELLAEELEREGIRTSRAAASAILDPSGAEELDEASSLVHHIVDGMSPRDQRASTGFLAHWRMRYCVEHLQRRRKPADLRWAEAVPALEALAASSLRRLQLRAVARM